LVLLLLLLLLLLHLQAVVPRPLQILKCSASRSALLPPIPPLGESQQHARMLMWHMRMLTEHLRVLV
jgi:hypothetical protein